MAKKTLSQQIEENAAAPAETSIDGTTVKEHSLADQIAAARYISSNRAKRRPGSGITIGKIQPHGSVE